MISYVAKIISYFALIVQTSLLVASAIGKVIVSVISGVTSVLINIIENFTIFVRIVYEDNITIFAEDLPNAANDIVETAIDQTTHIQNFILSVYNKVCHNTNVLIASAKWIVNSVIIIFVEVFLLIKNTVILLGNTIWFILTFIPVHLPQVMKIFFNYLIEVIYNFTVNTYMALLKVTNYLTDVPLESFIGLISAIIIIRLCIEYHEQLLSQITDFYWILVRKLTYLYYAVYNYVTDSDTRIITQMVNGEDLGVREMDIRAEEVIDAENAAESLCVICQERQKCVLTLPCRHVCLCTDCCLRLYGYQRTCPICRTFIYHSVTVYL